MLTIKNIYTYNLDDLGRISLGYFLRLPFLTSENAHQEIKFHFRNYWKYSVDRACWTVNPVNIGFLIHKSVQSNINFAQGNCLFMWLWDAVPFRRKMTLNVYIMYKNVMTTRCRWPACYKLTESLELVDVETKQLLVHTAGPAVNEMRLQDVTGDLEVLLGFSW